MKLRSVIALIGCSVLVGGCAADTNTESPIMRTTAEKVEAATLREAFQKHCVANFPNHGRTQRSLKDDGYTFVPTGLERTYAKDTKSARKGAVKISFGDEYTAHGEWVSRSCSAEAELIDHGNFDTAQIGQILGPKGEALIWDRTQTASFKSAGRDAEIIADKPRLITVTDVDEATDQSSNRQEWSMAALKISSPLTEADHTVIQNGADLPAFSAQ